MLEDFVDDLKQALGRRLDAARADLESPSLDPAAPRGRIEALKGILVDIDDLLATYSAPESVPDQMRFDEGDQPRTRRSYGRAA